MKTCPKCKIAKPNTDFNKDRTRKDGLFSYCRDCCKAMSAFTGEYPKSRTCPKCGEEKAASEYYHNKARTDGLCSYCKTCSDLAQRKKRPVVLGVKKPRAVVQKQVNRQNMVAKYGTAIVDAMESTQGEDNECLEFYRQSRA